MTTSDIPLNAPLRELGIKIPYQGINVYSMGHRALLYILETGYRAADTMQTMFQKNPYGFRVVFHHRLYCHILGYGHDRTSLTRI
jgi:hypothetical protein